MKLYKPELSNLGSLENIGEDTVIHSHTWIGDKVKIGKRCKIQAFSFIPNGVTIGDDVFIGPHVCFTNDNYPPSHGKDWKETIVRDGASVGANSTILAGIEIGTHAMVGAGSVIRYDVPAGEVWAGNQAHFIRKR